MNRTASTPVAGPTSTMRAARVARIVLPFAVGYFLSYVYRTVNAVIAPDIAADTGLSAPDIGLLTSMYFLAFAAFQLPLGLLLDRFGPRRVESVLLLFAALGALLFGVLDGLAGLALGRALIGVGVSCCLMASFKAFVLWFPRERLPAMNGFMLAFGGLGALSATVPVELLLNIVDWRGLFVGLALVTAVAAAAVFVVVPEHRAPAADTGVRDQLAGLWQVFHDAYFWRIAPTAAITVGVSLSVQSLWAGPWLRDVQGLAPVAVATHLMVAAAAMGVGFPLMGVLAQWVWRLGIRPLWLAGVGMTGFMVVVAVMATGPRGHSWLLMAAFGLLAASGSLSYALLGQHFPRNLVGRANTAQNLMVFTTAFLMQWGLGAIIGQWEDPVTGHYQPFGYQLAFGILVVLQALAMTWFFLVSRRYDRR